ncbi:MAG: Holliday junction branch migration DNA helicase RuvB [Dehalococcoidia bacterium]|nr:Holliday junction branch migration DNA helicase RuvB [Dehalococcoidia bacterium]
MAREEIIKNFDTEDLEDQNDIEEVYQSINLRPKNLLEYVGQKSVVNSLQTAMKAAKNRKEPLEHVLFHGPPGLGKTTLAHVIATESGYKIIHTSGPSLERPADMVGLLSNLNFGDVLFIDEIHRISKGVEEYMYSAMEDFKVDFITGSGTFAKTLSFPLQRFTLVGATTRAGMLSAPLRDRFGLTYHVDYYSPEELSNVIKRSSELLGIKISNEGSYEIANRSRGTPRIANRLLRRVRDYSEVHENGNIDKNISQKALQSEGVDELGLDRLDREYLKTLLVNYKGGPAGIEALAATINEESQTLMDVVEPFLLKIGFVVRTPSGRKATEKAYSYLNISNNKKSDQAQLF